MALINCPECTNTISDKSTACPYCGCPISGTPPVINNYNVVRNSNKNRVVAILLALFLGGFGIHKFYLGQTLWGIIYLLFCWTFIPAIIAFFEFFILLFMSDSTFEKRFG